MHIIFEIWILCKHYFKVLQFKISWDAAFIWFWNRIELHETSTGNLYYKYWCLCVCLSSLKCSNPNYSSSFEAIGETFELKIFFSFRKIVIPSWLLSFILYYCHSFRISSNVGPKPQNLCKFLYTLLAIFFGC